MAEHISRRSFVTGAAVAATAAAAASITTTPARAEQAAEEPKPDSGVMRICISCNDLDKSINFFTGMFEYTLVGTGILLPEEVKALYGLEGGARYAMVKNEYQSTVIQFI